LIYGGDSAKTMRSLIPAAGVEAGKPKELLLEAVFWLRQRL
jgi:hypothetical protein